MSDDKNTESFVGSSIRIRIEGDALVRLNTLSDQFRLSRTQIVALLVESVPEEDIVKALLNQNET